MQRNLSHNAETLVEVIIAVSILLVVLTPAMTTAVTGTDSISAMRDYAIAENLAKSGVEGIRALIEGNVLRLSGDIENCWNIKDDPSIVDTTVCTANKLTNGHYIVGIDTATGATIVTLQTTTLNLRDGITSADSPFLLSIENTTKLYVHQTGTDTTATRFYREITIKYHDEIMQAMGVVSKVEWVGDRGVSKVVARKTFTKEN